MSSGVYAVGMKGHAHKSKGDSQKADYTGNPHTFIDGFLRMPFAYFVTPTGHCHSLRVVHTRYELTGLLADAIFPIQRSVSGMMDIILRIKPSQGVLIYMLIADYLTYVKCSYMLNICKFAYK